MKKNHIPPANYVPFSLKDILSKFVDQQELAYSNNISLIGSEADIANVRKLFSLIKNQVHLEFHQTIEDLDQSYEPFNPNGFGLVEAPELDSSVFVKHLEYVLEKADYKALSQDELKKSFHAASMFKIRLHVDFDDYQRTVVFARGESMRKESVYLFRRFFKRDIEFRNYDSVVVFLHFKDEVIDAALKGSCVPGSVVLKMFQNVPKSDLEMLFPNTKIRMRLKDKLIIGIPALVSGIVVAATKLGASFLLLGALIGFWLGFSNEPVTLNKTSLLVLLAGFGALGGYLWKQFDEFNQKKSEFTQKLVEKLYFKNLDNNEGVYYRLVNEAERQECKEILLVYFYLLQSGKAMETDEIDQGLECWIESIWERKVDFDTKDALEKLQRLNLVTRADLGFTVLII